MTLSDSQSTSTNNNSSYNETEDSSSKSSMLMMNSTAAAAAKRKGSFKKWLRSSHRKFTSSNTSRANQTAIIANQKLNLTAGTDFEGIKIKVQKILRKIKIFSLLKFFKYFKKVLSNSEDLKIKRWLIEEHNEEQDECVEANSQVNENEQRENLILQEAFYCLSTSTKCN